MLGWYHNTGTINYLLPSFFPCFLPFLPPSFFPCFLTFITPLFLSYFLHSFHSSCIPFLPPSFLHTFLPSSLLFLPVLTDIIHRFWLKVPERLGEENRFRLQMEREEEEPTLLGFLGRRSLYYCTEVQRGRFPLFHCHLKTETDPVPKMLWDFSQRCWTVSKISAMPVTIMKII